MFGAETANADHKLRGLMVANAVPAAQCASGLVVFVNRPLVLVPLLVAVATRGWKYHMLTALSFWITHNERARWGPWRDLTLTFLLDASVMQT